MFSESYELEKVVFLLLIIDLGKSASSLEGSDVPERLAPLLPPQQAPFCLSSGLSLGRRETPGTKLELKEAAERRTRAEWQAARGQTVGVPLLPGAASVLRDLGKANSLRGDEAGRVGTGS